MTTINIAELRQLVADATPGPWRDNVLGSEGYQILGSPIPVGSRGMTRPTRVARCGYEDWDTDKANAALIAAAVTSLPALLDEIEWMSRYAPSRTMADLLERSSLGSDEAKAARDRVSPDVGRLILRLSSVMGERDDLRTQLDAVLALHKPDSSGWCDADGLGWPCGTARACGVTE